jgi:Trk-type K+ transport system membrane component
LKRVLRIAVWHPTRIVPLAFLASIAAGTLFLLLPISRAGPGGAPFIVALFTATSAVCVTGLTVVDTGSYWSPFGHGVILLLVQLGGLGIMTAATLLGLLVSNRLRLSQRLLAQAESRTTSLGDVRATLRLVLLIMLTVQSIVASFLFVRFWVVYDHEVGRAAWTAIFHGVMAFNNAGFTLFSDGTMGFVRDGWILLPVMAGVFLGSIGFPVLYELKQQAFRPAAWSFHTKLTLLGTAILLPGGALLVLLFEWWNPATLGPLPVGAKLLNAAFHSVMSRSGGFHAVDTGAMQDETLLATTGLMLIGGGSAGTAGGIKVTTFLVLGLVVLAEIQGERDASGFRRRVSGETQRLALTVVLLSIAAIGVGTLALLSMAPFTLSRTLFEVVSAFATVGLSAGITADLPPAGQMVLVILMFAGRVGTVTLAAALALRARQRPYRFPEERPIIG